MKREDEKSNEMSIELFEKQIGFRFSDDLVAESVLKNLLWAISQLQ